MTFAAQELENPLEITLRQAQDDFSLDTMREVIHLQTLRKSAGRSRHSDNVGLVDRFRVSITAQVSSRMVDSRV